jgi:NADPH:quinone reductase-like Zn-dependent oxidoreductase
MSMTDVRAHMRAAVLTGHGGFDCLEVRGNVPVPVPGPEDVLIQVGAAAVNNTDINTRIGWYDDGGWAGSLAFPRIQGIDACGTVIAVGDQVDLERVGQRVLVQTCWTEASGRSVFLGSEVDGAFADYLVVPSIAAHTVRCALSDVELASFPCSYSTAENMLGRAAVGPGQRVLVTGASGGVGSAAVQLAARRNAYVAAIAATDKHADITSLGAGSVVDRHADLVEAFGRNTFDAVIDVVGGESWPSLLRMLRPRGQYAVAGAIGGPMVELDLRTLYLNDLDVHGCTRTDAGVFADLVGYIERGEVRPLVAATFPLEQIVDAQRLFLTKRHVGKIVLQIGQRDIAGDGFTAARPGTPAP